MNAKRAQRTAQEIEAAKERRREWDRARHARDKEKRNAARRIAHAANPDRIRNIERERYKADPSKKKKNDIVSKYGRIAYVAHRSINHCEACGDLVDGKQKHIDHDHCLPSKHGFRGILCGACNVALGYLKEDERRIIALANYINRKRKATAMEKFTKCAAQGDLMLRRIDKLPDGVKPLTAEKGVFVVAHSETGHNHVIDASPNVKWYGTDDSMVSYLEVVEATDATEILLRHLRGHDTHKTIVIPPGVFEIRRQREYTPEGWRRVED